MSLISWLFQPLLVQAQGQFRGGLQTAVGGTGLPTQSLPNLAANLIIIVLGLVGIIFMLLIFYAGFTWMVGGRDGNEKEIAKAKTILSAATIGLLIVVGAYAITYFIASNIISITSDQPAPVETPPTTPQ